jgi:hypothetical protein
VVEGGGVLWAELAEQCGRYRREQLASGGEIHSVVAIVDVPSCAATGAVHSSAMGCRDRDEGGRG